MKFTLYVEQERVWFIEVRDNYFLTLKTGRHLGVVQFFFVGMINLLISLFPNDCILIILLLENQILPYLLDRQKKHQIIADLHQCFEINSRCRPPPLITNHSFHISTEPGKARVRSTNRDGANN